MNKFGVVTGVFCVAIAASMALPALAQEKQQTGVDISKETPSGTIDVDAEQVRLIIGGSGGKGVLHYKGKDYPFTFKGGSVGGIGVTKMRAVGNVYLLNKVEDFPGTYTAVTAGAAVGGGKGMSSFQNNKGVYLDVKSKTEGLALNLGLAVATVEFVK